MEEMSVNFGLKCTFKVFESAVRDETPDDFLEDKFWIIRETDKEKTKKI